MQRFVDSYFYKNSFVLICDWSKFEKHFSREKFFDLYFQRLQTIGISDLRLIYGECPLLEFNNNGLIERVQRKSFDKTIYFFVCDFLTLDIQKKISILSNLFQFMYDLWEYAEQHYQDMTKGYCDTVLNFFDFYSLFKSIEHFIQDVFLDGKDIRDFIMEQILLLEDRTKNSKLYSKSNYDYFFNTPNQYNVFNFVTNIGDINFTQNRHNSRYWILSFQI
jgi:hypothetical protein